MHQSCKPHMLTLPTLSTLPILHHHSLEQFGHISAIFPTISLLSSVLLNNASKCISPSLGFVIHLRVSLRDIISHSPTGYGPRGHRQSTFFKLVRIKEDCCHAIRHEATSKHLSWLVIIREASVREFYCKSYGSYRNLIELVEVRGSI